MIRLQNTDVIYNNTYNLGHVKDLLYKHNSFIIQLPGRVLTISEKGCSLNEQNVFTAYHIYYEASGGQPSTGLISDEKTKVIAEMRNMCRYKIINEFQSDCLGEMLQFDCEDTTDQPKVFAYYFKATLMMANDPDCANVLTNELRWKPSKDDICSNFTPLQIKKLGEDMQSHITIITDRYHELKVWAKNQTNISTLNNWNWNMTIN